jgi:hypothetical protein
LEQKQKMIKDSENLQKLQTQGSIAPLGNVATKPYSSTGNKSANFSSTGGGQSNQVKDLTETLMAANLNRLIPYIVEILTIRC